MTSQTYQLVMQKGPNPGKVFELVQDELTIGRDITNRVVINDPEISRRHSKLTAQMGGYVIEDLGSTNGTFVDGQRLMGPHALRPGQTIMLGEKIVLAYEAIGFDPNATLVGGASPQTMPTPRDATTAPVGETPAYIPPAPAYVPPPAPVYQPPAYQEPAYIPPAPPAPPAAAYSGQVPAGPGDEYAPVEEYEEQVVEEAPARSSRTALLVGCGVLLVILCCVVVGAIAFDTMDLYCQPPFDALSGILWTCTP